MRSSLCLRAQQEAPEPLQVALERTDGPTVLVLSRQGMTEYSECTMDGVAKGGYVTKDCDGDPTHILIGTGTELQNCMEAAEKLAGEGVKVRVPL